MAIQKTHDQKRHHKVENIRIGECTLFGIKSKGADSVISICDDTYGTAGCEHLNNRVMPTRREEGVELFRIRKREHLVLDGVEALAKDGMT